ncbi:MAG: glycosyltransferase family 39 protein, partial [Patescibacteria group bacterium]
TAILGTATIYVIYNIGKEIQDKKLGLLAATLFAFLPLHVKYSHYTHVDIPLTLTTTLALFTALRIRKTGLLKWYIATGALTGISGAIHYTGFVIGIALVFAHALHNIRSRNIIAGLIVIPVSFAICTPYTLIKWQESSAIYHQLQLRGAAGDLGYTRPDFLWPLYTVSPDWGLPFTLSGVLWEFHPAVVVLAALGILLALYKRNWNIFILISCTLVVMYITIIGRLPLYAIKRLLPLAPLLALLAAWAIYELFHSKKMSKYVAFPVSVALVAIIVLQNMVTGVGFAAAYTHGSTHSTAVAWALQNIPRGSVVLQHTPIKLIDWNDTNYKTVRMNEVYANFNKQDPEVGHDRAKPLSYWTKEQGVEYVAMDSRIVDRYFDPTSVKLFPETTTSYQAFYTKIRSEGTLLYRIEPKLYTQAGPRVEIYDIRGIQ